jgi:hypothetical protein
MAKDDTSHYDNAPKLIHGMAGGGSLAEALGKKLAESATKSIAKRMSAAEKIAAGYKPEMGYGVLQKKPISEMTSTKIADPMFNPQPTKIITPENLYGGVGIPLVGDRADAGKILTHIEGNALPNPVQLGGGKDYMKSNTGRLDPSENSVWSSDPNVITKLTNAAKRAQETGRPVYGVNVLGSPTNVDFNNMTTSSLIQQLDLSALRKKDIKAFNTEVRKEFPDFVGIEHPELHDQMTNTKGKNRTAFVQTMGKSEYQNAGFPNVTSTIKAVTSPDLYDVPTGTAGLAIAKLGENAGPVEKAIPHGTYPVGFGSPTSEYVGDFGTGLDFRKIFSDFNEYRRLFGKDPKDDYRSLSLSAPPIQEFNQEWLDQVMPTYEQIMASKKAKGGAIELENQMKMEQEQIKHMAGGGALAEAIGKKLAEAATKSVAKKTAYELAHELAQKNAVKMLGLHPENTAMDRAKAMGFDIENTLYRGTNEDEVKLKPSTGHEHGVSGISTTFDPQYAGMHGDVTMPLLGKKVNAKDYFDLVNEFKAKTGKDLYDATESQFTNFLKKNKIGASILHDPFAGLDIRYLNPIDLRSKFAAFDPAQVNDVGILKSKGGLLAKFQK